MDKLEKNKNYIIIVSTQSNTWDEELNRLILILKSKGINIISFIKTNHKEKQFTFIEIN